MYINSDLSWILFNKRVLEIACMSSDVRTKIKFLKISINNLYEFFSVVYDSTKYNLLPKDYNEINDIYNYINGYIFNSHMSIFLSIKKYIKYDSLKQNKHYYNSGIFYINKISDIKKCSINIKYILIYNYKNIVVINNNSNHKYNLFKFSNDMINSQEYFLLEIVYEYNSDKKSTCIGFGNRSIIDINVLLNYIDISIKDYFYTLMHLPYPIFNNCNIINHDSIDKCNNNELYNYSWYLGVLQKLSNNDIILYHPYNDFLFILYFLKNASIDPDVIEIYHTIYRTEKDSLIIKYLIDAQKNGKSVNVFVECKARFNEALNKYYVMHLLENGIKVFSEFPLKVHCKFMVIIKKESNKSTKLYSHICTGNYNYENAQTYQDFSYFTSKKGIGFALADIFKYVSKENNCYINSHIYRGNLMISPYDIRDVLLQELSKLYKLSKKGVKVSCILKTNALDDMQMINTIYNICNNNQDMLSVFCIVRGICVLKKLFSNIKIYSILGNYLEHARVYYFNFGNGEDVLYISSADLMHRNLDNRVELLLKIDDINIKKFILDILTVMCNDIGNSWELSSDDVYQYLGDKGKYDQIYNDIGGIIKQYEQ